MPCDWNWAGSKWWKIDCHCHTPASRDYGKGDRQAEYRGVTPENWLLDYMRAGIDGVVVTDHNTGEWIDRLKNALKFLESNPPQGFRKFYIFPGVEISVNGGCHMLAVFPFDKSSADISTLLGAVGYTGEQGGTADVTSKSCNEVVFEIAKMGGIPIPAHVDQECGLFTVVKGATLEQILDSEHITAMCLRVPTFQKPGIYNNSRKKWAEIIGSDSHHPSNSIGPQKPGSHYTWFKMTEPSFEGLKLALLDGELSLKRSDVETKDPNAHGDLVFMDISVLESKYMGREAGRSFSVKLNPWLNTIIGGRGTGKSSILEFMRNPLNRNNDNIPNELTGELSKYRDIYVSKVRDGLLLNNTSIVMNVLKDGIQYQLSWDVKNRVPSIKELEHSGDWVEALGDIRQRFPVRIYSQKQIFEFAKNPQSLLKVIDESDAVNYASWKSEFKDLVSQYMARSLQIREAQEKISDESAVRGNLADINRKLTILEQGGYSELFKMHQFRLLQQKMLSAWNSEIERITGYAMQYAESVQNISFNVTELNENSIDIADLNASIGLMRDAIEQYRSKLNLITAELLKSHEDWRIKSSSFSIVKEIENDRCAYENSIERLSNEGMSESLNFDFLFKQREDLERKINIIAQRKIEIEEYHKNRNDIYSKIIELRESLTKKRILFLNEVLSENQYLSISVIPYGDSDEIITSVRALINCDKGFDRYFSDDPNESILAELLDSTDKFASVQKFHHLIYDLFSNKQDVVNRYDSRFVSRIQTMTPEQIERLFIWFPDDALDVRYKVEGSSRPQPIRQASPGQKTSALLSFILSYGNEPLIIDQPEDDLDNRLIYDLIVKHLRQIKLVRQIIIVTHNANIVVNGDAENIIALDVVNGQTMIHCQGSLQDSNIRSSICNIMEGGEEALEQRYRRIKCK